MSGARKPRAVWPNWAWRPDRPERRTRCDEEQLTLPIVDDVHVPAVRQREHEARR